MPVGRLHSEAQGLSQLEKRRKGGVALKPEIKENDFNDLRRRIGSTARRFMTKLRRAAPLPEPCRPVVRYPRDENTENSNASRYRTLASRDSDPDHHPALAVPRLGSRKNGVDPAGEAVGRKTDPLPHRRGRLPQATHGIVAAETEPLVPRRAVVGRPWHDFPSGLAE